MSTETLYTMLIGRLCLSCYWSTMHRPKPGNYLEHAMARLTASNITVLFSQSQGKFSNKGGLSPNT